MRRCLASLAIVSLFVHGCAGDGQADNAEPDAGERDAGAEHEAWLDSPLAAYPAELSAVGIYPDLTDTDDVSPRALGYVPQFPLWSNGSTKQRYLVLPAGDAIDAAQDPWSFPAGTLFFKTFAFEDEHGAARNVETRILRATASGWDYAAYLWNAEQDEATLLDGRTATDVTVWLGGESFEHQVPSRRECRECHESAPAFVLGFTAWQLDYVAAAGADAHADTELARLSAAHAFASTPEGHALSDEDETHWVKGYVAANCSHCHNGGDGSNNAFDLRPDVFIENTVGHETESSASGTGVRIVAGKPAQSVLYLGFTGQDNGTGIKAMPPLGVQRRDAAAAERIAAWIETL